MPQFGAAAPLPAENLPAVLFLCQTGHLPVADRLHTALLRRKPQRIEHRSSRSAHRVHPALAVRARIQPELPEISFSIKRPQDRFCNLHQTAVIMRKTEICMSEIASAVAGQQQLFADARQPFQHRDRTAARCRRDRRRKPRSAAADDQYPRTHDACGTLRSCRPLSA